jgi:hypothetical protein
MKDLGDVLEQPTANKVQILVWNSLASTYLRHSLSIQPHDDPTKRLSVMLNIEIDLIRNLGSFGGSSLAHEQKCSGQDDHQRDHDSL